MGQTGGGRAQGKGGGQTCRDPAPGKGGSKTREAPTKAPCQASDAQVVLWWREGGGGRVNCRRQDRVGPVPKHPGPRGKLSGSYCQQRCCTGEPSEATAREEHAPAQTTPRQRPGW